MMTQHFTCLFFVQLTALHLETPFKYTKVKVVYRFWKPADGKM
jgi:hypothetical protein